jgi:class 3 adenylate cyclase
VSAPGGHGAQYGATLTGVNARDSSEAALAAVGEVMRSISSSGFNLDDVLRSVNRSAVELSGAEFGNILRFDEGGFYRIVAWHGDVEESYLDIVTSFQYKPDRGSMIGRVLVERRPVHLADVLEDPEYTAWDIYRATRGYRTILGVPMIDGDEMIGLFVLWRYEVKPFTDAEISLVTTFANQAVLAIQNLRLFQTVQAQQTELARYAPQAAALLTSESGEQMLAGHRREITAMFCDLRGFTAFAESAEPEEVLGVLREYHGAVGEVVVGAGGTVEHFAGDGLMAFFNDPTPIENHAAVAVGAAVQIRTRFEKLAAGWQKRGYELGLGIGLALGFATLGRIGFDGRFDYGAVGNVVILASRLSDAAAPGEILVSQRLNAVVEDTLQTDAADELTLKGFTRAIQAYRVISRGE